MPPPPECVLCPACRTHITVTHFPTHYLERCRYRPGPPRVCTLADAEAVLAQLPRATPAPRRGLADRKQALRRALNAHYTYRRRLDGPGQYPAPLPPATNIQTTCRFCGAEAMPGERVCYACSQGGG